MKKIITFLIALFILLMPSIVCATIVEEPNYSIENVYINSSVDPLGSVRITEAIIIKGSLNGFERTINYINPTLGKWDGSSIDFEKSAIYNGRAVDLLKVSALKIEKEDINWSILSKNFDKFEEKESVNRGDNGVYTVENNSYGIKIRTYNTNNSGYIVYLFDYYIAQAVVLHNDVAELYWTYIPQDFDDIKEAHLQLIIPGKCSDETFRVWAHGPLNGEVKPISTTKDESGNYLYNGLVADVTSIKEGQGMDIRMTYDKSIMSMAYDVLDNSNTDALNAIIEVETKRANDANKIRKISKFVYNAFIFLSGAYIIGLIIIWIIVYKKYDKEYNVGFDHKYYREFTGDYGVEVIDYLMTKDVSTNAMSASIMNLIYKKKIQLMENPEDKKNPTLKLVDKENISNAENEIMELLFDKIGINGMVTMKNIEKYSKSGSTAQKFMDKYNSWKGEVEAEAVSEDFFENNNSKKLLAGLYILIGIAIIFAMVTFDFVIIPIILLICVLSVVFLTYLISFKKWTKKGREHYLKWKAFKNFLQDFGSFQDKDLPEVILWEKYLVYATVFGLSKEVQKTMKVKLTEMGYDDTYMNNADRWYLHNNYIANSISDTITKSYSSSLSTINAEAASSSMSSGGGFGGGFSSGGGFGGGGGGGHGF